MPPNSPRGSGGNKSTDGSAARATALGEFSGLARWITTPMVRTIPEEKIEPARLPTAAKENFAEPLQAEGPEDQASDTDLGPLLAAIADDVHRCAAAACAGIIADFAARVAYARKHLPRHQLAAALGALAQERKAALALVKRNAALELAARKKAVIEARRPKRGPRFKPFRKLP
jgi:hypothetical protein